MYNRFNSHSKSSLEAASEAAAKVNAMLIAEGKLKLSQVNQHYTSRAKPGGLFVSEVEINDAPLNCRNILTKGTTQEDVMKLSGAAVSTRGRYLTFEQKTKGSEHRPLYLYVQGTTQQSVNIAVKRINEIMKEAEGKSGWIDNNQFISSPPPPPINQIPPQGPPPPPIQQQPTFLRPPPPEPAMVTFLQEKLYIGLEHAPPSFDVKNKITGPGGSYLRHVMSESGAIATLCGKGSGFGDPDSIEPMHIQLQHPSMEGLQQAKALASNLIQTVQQEYAQFQQALAAMPQAITAGIVTSSPLFLEQPSLSIPGGGALIGQPGLTNINQPITINQPAALPPGMAPAGHPQMVGTAMMPVSTPTSLMMPTSSLSSLGLQQGFKSEVFSSMAPSVMLPSSISSSYTTMAITSPLVASPLPTGHIISHNIEGGLNNENVVLVPNTSVPPPILQAPNPQPHQFDMNNPNNQFIAVPEGQILVGQPQPASGQPMTMVGPPQTVLPPGQLQTIITTPNGQTMELVQHPAAQPQPQHPPHQPPPQHPQPQPSPHPHVTPNQPNPHQHLPMVGQHVPSFPIRSSQAYNDISTSTVTMVATSTSHPYNTAPKEEGKRRFTEEKPDDGIPDNLLGYQHGPLHLLNQNVSQAASGSNTHNGANNQQGLYASQAPSFDASRPPYTEDQHLMPPPKKSGLKRSGSGGDDEPKNKKEKNALKKVADYGSEEDGNESDGEKKKTGEKEIKPLENHDLHTPQPDVPVDQNFQPYKVAISSAATLYRSQESMTQANAAFPVYSQPPPDQQQYLTVPLSEQPLYQGQTLAVSSQPIPVPSISLSAPSHAITEVQSLQVAASQQVLPGQPIQHLQPINNQAVPAFSQQAMPPYSQAVPVYSQALPVPNQPTTLHYRPPSPHNVPLSQWASQTSSAPYFQNNQPPPPQWNGQNGGVAEPVYTAPTSQTMFHIPPPPTSIPVQFQKPPPTLPYWIPPN